LAIEADSMGNMVSLDWLDEDAPTKYAVRKGRKG